MLNKLHIIKDDTFSKGVIFVFILFLIIIVSSCSSNKKERKQVDIKTEAPKEKKKLSVELLGEIRSRRSYADIQFMNDERQIDKYLAEQKKSDPYVYDMFSGNDSSLYNHFIRLGLIKYDGIQLKKFKLQKDSSTSFIDSLGVSHRLIFYYNESIQHLHFKLFSSSDSINVDTQSFPLQNLDYAFIDVIPRGNKELVFLDDYYIMNGDNFDFKVYEIKTY